MRMAIACAGTSGRRNNLVMNSSELIQELSRGYVCPPDASPAWRAAHDYGFDMSLVEAALKMSPEERLEAHQRALDMMLELQENGEARHAAK